MTALTPDALARIEELAQKATPGPWAFLAGGILGGVCSEDGTEIVEPGEIRIADARFTAAAREAVPALVAGVRSLQARVTAAEAERDHYRLMMAEAKAALGYAAESLSEFAYDELASAINDEWTNDNGHGTATRTLARVKAEAAAQALEEASWADTQGTHNPAQVRDMMRARAAAIRQEARP